MKRLSVLALALTLTACADHPLQPTPSGPARAGAAASGPPITFDAAACSVQADLSLRCGYTLSGAGERTVDFFVRGEWEFDYECRNKKGIASRKDSGTFQAFGLAYVASRTGNPVTGSDIPVAVPTQRPSCPKNAPTLEVLDIRYSEYWEIEARASDGTRACSQSDPRYGCAS